MAHKDDRVHPTNPDLGPDNVWYDPSKDSSRGWGNGGRTHCGDYSQDTPHPEMPRNTRKRDLDVTRDDGHLGRRDN